MTGGWRDSSDAEIEIAQLRDQIAWLRRELKDTLTDRDEWREQHENLLSVRQSDLAILAKARGQ